MLAQSKAPSKKTELIVLNNGLSVKNMDYLMHTTLRNTPLKFTFYFLIFRNKTHAYYDSLNKNCITNS